MLGTRKTPSPDAASDTQALGTQELGHANGSGSDQKDQAFLSQPQSCFQQVCKAEQLLQERVSEHVKGRLKELKAKNADAKIPPALLATPDMLAHLMAELVGVDWDNFSGSYFFEEPQIGKLLLEQSLAIKCHCTTYNQCGIRRLRLKACKLAGKVADVLGRLLKVDYRKNEPATVNQLKSELKGYYMALFDEWKEAGIAKSEEEKKTLLAAIDDFVPSEVEVQKATQRIKQRETEAYCRQSKPLLTPGQAYVHSLLNDLPKELQESRDTVIAWIRKVLVFLTALREFDGVFFYASCLLPLLYAKTVTPSRYFLVCVLGYIAPTMARCRDSQQELDEVNALKSQAWDIFPDMDTKLRQYKDSFMFKKLPGAAEWAGVRDRMRQANTQRDLQQACLEANQELNRLRAEITGQ